jgi:uncharacterized protein (TIGR02246 family)
MAEASGDVVRELYASLLEAWNRRDADAYAALFADDGAMIGFDGSEAETPAGIAGHLGPIFADHPTATYVAKVRGTREVGQDAVVLRAIAGMVPPDADEPNPKVNALHTVVAERRDEGWRIVLFQNTAAQYHGRPEATEAHTAEVKEVRRTGATIA